MLISRYRGLVFLLFLICLPFYIADRAEAGEKVEVHLVEPKLNVPGKGEVSFSVRVDVPKEHHAYLDSGEEGFFIPLEFDFDELREGGFEVREVERPKGEREEKAKAAVLREKADFRFSLKAVGPSPKSKTYQAVLQSQICNDITNICFPPQAISFAIPIGFQEGETQAGESKSEVSRTEKTIPAPSAAPQEEGEGITGWLLGKYKEYSKNIFVSFLLMVLAGILAAATPCVYPMLPITSAILMQRGGDSRQEGIKHSYLYFAGIILTYAVMGYAAGMTGGALNTIMRSAAVNLSFAVFFALFGLSMLGFYDFALGQDFMAKIDSSVSKKGGYTGTLLVGMVAGLVVSPCVGPVVFALLLQVANRIAELSAELVVAGTHLSLVQKSLIAGKGGIMMAGFGVGIGVPFLLVGLFSNKMPRAGTWMVYVKYILGFAILYFAFAYYMKGMGVARVQAEVAYGILLGAGSIFISVYLGLFQAWDAKISVNGKFKKTCAILLLIFGVHFFFNGLGQSGLLLESKLLEGKGGGGGAATSRVPEVEKHGNLTWNRDLESAKALARKENMPIFIDFYADWCANCVAFKKLSLSDAELNQALQKAVLLKIYDTDEIFKIFQEDPQYQELKTGLPFFVILKPNGEFFWKGTQYDAVKIMKKMIESAVS